MADGIDKLPLFTSAALINDEWLDEGAQGRFSVVNPASGETLAEVPALGADQVDQAIAAAFNAASQWRQTPAGERGKRLHALARRMREERGQLAKIMVAEQGKPYKEALGEVAYAANYYQWFAEEAVRHYGDIIPAANADQTILVDKEPVGVCAFITPWNFPLAMLARKAAAAFAAGCTVVAKPSSLTPLSALAMAKLALEVGFPAGVFNLITGDSKLIGQQLCKDPRIAKLSFTGSTAVGRDLASQCAPDFKRLSLELGGNAPFIVFEDADIDRAVQGLIAAKFRNNGQTCVCVNRLFVQQSIYQRFVAALAKAVAALKVGDAYDEQTDLTVLINDQAVEKFNHHLRDALAKGGRRVLGGEAESRVAKPTLIDQGSVDMVHCQEETFGPLLVAIAFADEQDVIAFANDTPYGLAAYFYSQNLARIKRVSRALQAGMVGVNETAISNVAAPFGGLKHSGYGREGSKYGLDEYTELKYVLLGV